MPNILYGLGPPDALKTEPAGVLPMQSGLKRIQFRTVLSAFVIVEQSLLIEQSSPVEQILSQVASTLSV